MTAFRGGNPRRIIQLAVSEKIVLYSSKLLIEELQTTLNYPKLQRRLEKLAITAEELLVEVTAIIQLSQPVSIPDVDQLRDPKDKILLETALAVPVEVIISGDEDLLILKEFQEIPILTNGHSRLRRFTAE